jgi:hypothetical protein
MEGMKSLMIGIVVLIAVAMFAYTFFLKQVMAPAPSSLEDQGAVYENKRFGLSFVVPLGYVLSEGEAGTNERKHHVITLIRKEDIPPPVNGEGPPSITINVYQNNLDTLTLDDWLVGRNESNFKLGDGTSARTSVDGKEAVSYRWSGLYEAQTVAFLHTQSVVAVSVTYLDLSDDHVDAYLNLLTSISLADPKNSPY